MKNQHLIRSHINSDKLSSSRYILGLSEVDVMATLNFDAAAQEEEGLLPIMWLK